MIGVRKMMVEFDACESMRRGTAHERKRTSSVIGPYESLDGVWQKVILMQALTATKFRYPIQPLITASAPCRRTQLFQPPSTIPASNKGPKKSKAVKARPLAVSARPKGKYTIRWRALENEDDDVA